MNSPSSPVRFGEAFRSHVTNDPYVLSMNTESPKDAYNRLVESHHTHTTDSGLLIDIMSHLFNYNVNHVSAPRSLSIVSTCSSLGSTYAYIVPQILSHYLHLAHSNPSFTSLMDITANVVHVIPQHKTIKAEYMDDNSLSTSTFSSRSNSSASTDCTFESFNGVYDIHESGTNYSISPKNSIFSPTAMASLLKSQQKPDLKVNTHYTYNEEFHTISPALSPVVSLPALTSGEEDANLEERIYNTFAFMPRRANAQVVPPNSTHYNFALYPLPSHVLPSFQDVISSRFTETIPSGLMVVCYPTSLSLYYKYILPCLDLALHQMLALNMISTQACEAITVPPPSPVYSFETQLSMVQNLPDAEIVYSRKIQDYNPSDWGYRWISEDMLWIRQTLANLDVSSQSIIKLISTLTRNPLWSVSGSCDISLFIVRKKSFS